MRRTAAALCCLLACLLLPADPARAADPKAPAAAAADPAAAYAGSHFKRATLLVTDLDRSLTLYRDVLGFKLDMILPLKETSYAYTMFNVDPAARMRMAFLSSDTQQRTLALIEVTGVPVPVPSAPRPASIVIDAADLPGQIAKAGALGLTVFKELKLTTVEGRTGKEQGLLDPDGHLVILYQLDGQ